MFTFSVFKNLYKINFFLSYKVKSESMFFSTIFLIQDHLLVYVFALSMGLSLEFWLPYVVSLLVWGPGFSPQ